MTTNQAVIAYREAVIHRYLCSEIEREMRKIEGCTGEEYERARTNYIKAHIAVEEANTALIKTFIESL